ncbi:uncharacterized protein LOC105193135 isoform X2 [Solenopsis invicta]|uniref:uncharacterized protein LOC105193135 isoform X2 n=1 Tax=Solenopsis invicta TaxID=13686 RepID=UPI00193E6B52|nr:uncharacterized protein LOC105193135 isoform X2 [Solenopsis invicta]
MATAERVLGPWCLEWRALYGEDASSNSDSDLYDVEGAPVTKKPKHSKTSVVKNLEVTLQWQCVLQDKWIIGVDLYNRSSCTLENPRYYPYVLSMRDEQISGESAFWKLEQERAFHSEKINSIQPGAVVATTVIDLGCYPMFDQEPVVKCWGIISYEIDDTQFQIPVPSIQLSIKKTLDSSCIKFLDERRYNTILALKSTSTIEKVVNVCFSRDDQDDQNGSGNELFHFLIRRTFAKVYDNVFLMKEHGSLMYCLIEVQSIDVKEARIRIFARSVNQLNVILHLLQDEFQNVFVVDETNDCVEAAEALIRELKMIRDKKSIRDIQEAKVITDLLIP